MKELLTLVRMGAAGEDYPEQDTSHFSVVSFQTKSCFIWIASPDEAPGEEI